MTLPELVIFDCDGVLVDSEPITNVILQADLEARGLPLTVDRIVELFVGGTIKGAGIRAAEMGADIPDGWADQMYETIYARLRQGVDLIDGVPELMDRLDVAGIPYCVGSNGSDEKMHITLGQHPNVFDRLVAKLYSAHTYGTAKPDPELFLIAARVQGVAPENCLVVDDSAAGCTAARRANMPCFGLAEHDDGAGLAAQNATVIHSISEIADRLGLPAAD